MSVANSCSWNLSTVVNVFDEAPRTVRSAASLSNKSSAGSARDTVKKPSKVEVKEVPDVALPGSTSRSRASCK